ncbi:porin family protein, partial [Vibrio parahaemolyticus]|nr:porin family protein [Vibrio parahaemolyticus]
MKKVLPLLALGAVVASASVQAKGNWYVGADILNSDLEVEGHSYSSSATGLGIAVGKELQYS